MPYCPECAASVPDGAAACPTCGASLAATAQEPEGAGPQDSDIELVTADLRNSLSPEYELLKVLGTGGMGAVFLMRQPALKRLVAVKVLAPWLASDAMARARFEREARAAAALSHPNVVRVYDEGETSGLRLPYLVMQYVDGPTLTEWMGQHRQASEREARRIIGEVASALAAAHDRQLVHRDVKPGNVIVERETGRAYVVDFGVSAALASAGEDDASRLTATGTVPGTPIYMSPEQASGEPVTPRSDVYSLGILAYELLVGELPYRARTAMGWAAAHLRDTPTPVRVHRADLAPEVAAIVDRCLAKAPAERPDAGEVARGLLPGIESEIEWPPPGLHWMRGRAAVLGRLGLVVTAGALLALTALLLTPPILRAHGNWLWRFQVRSVGSGVDPAAVPQFVWQSALALGLALFLLGTAAFLTLGSRLLARSVRLRRQGWHWETLAHLAADRDGRSGSVLAGTREFASLEALRRGGVLRARLHQALWRIGAGTWVGVGLGLWALDLALANPARRGGAPVVSLATWGAILMPPLAALVVSTWARIRERRIVHPLRRKAGPLAAATDAERWYRGLPEPSAPAEKPAPSLPRLARTAGSLVAVLGALAVLAIAEAAVAGVAAVIFTERLGPKTVAFTAEQARLQEDDAIRAAALATRRYVPREADLAPETAAELLRSLLQPQGTRGAPAYGVSPGAVVTEAAEALRDASRGALPSDSLALAARLGDHPRTAAFRALARFAALDSLFTPDPRRSRPPGGGADLSPVRTPLEDAALANIAGAVAAVARREPDSALARLGENAAFADALLRVPDPRANQIGARLLTRYALAPLASLAALRGDAAGSAQLADAALRMERATPSAGGAAGLAVDPRDLIEFTGAVASPRAPAGYRVAWLGEGWAGLCANPWELLAGPSDARREAILQTADLAADIPRARDIALSAGEEWSVGMRSGRGGLLGWLADRGPWGLVMRISACGSAT